MKKVIFNLSIIILVNNVYSQPRLNIHQFPEPDKTTERLFYIQRSLNKNTIVYDACFDKHGKLDIDKPVNVYWIRYDESGQKMPLRYFEKNFVFGVKTEKLYGQEYDFKVTIVASDKRVIYVKQIAPFKAVAYLNIKGSYSILDHIFVELSPEDSLDKIEYIELYGLAHQNPLLKCERIFL